MPLNDKTRLKNLILTVRDFPKKDVLFKDISPLLSDGNAFADVVYELSGQLDNAGPFTKICSPESRGFILGAAVASVQCVGFVPIRKEGKLPRRSYSSSYTTEYSKDKLFLPKDAFKKGERVVIIDDILATGGTVSACIDLVRQAGARVAKILFLGDILDLNALRDLSRKYNTFSLLGL